MPPAYSPRVLTATLSPPVANRCYSADGVSGEWPREARENHGWPCCLLGNVVFLGPWPASAQSSGLRSPSCRIWEILALQTPTQSGVAAVHPGSGSSRCPCSEWRRTEAGCRENYPQEAGSKARDLQDQQWRRRQERQHEADPDRRGTRTGS